MNWLRPVLAGLLGVVIAAAAGLVTFPVFVIADPVTRDTALAVGDLLFEVLSESAIDPSAGEEVGAFVEFLYSAIVTIGFLPILLVAAIGALTRQRGWLFFSAATGTISAAMPWVLRSAYRLPLSGSASVTELRFALVLFLTGVVVGSVYWFLWRILGPDERPSRS